MAKSRILIVDDEEGMLEVCSDTLRRLPEVEIVTESQSAGAAARLGNEDFDMLVVDIRMPGLSGVDLLRLGREHDQDLTVLMMTAFPTVETAVESMKLGAADYIVKPFLPDDLLAMVRRLLEQRELAGENRLLRRQVERPYAFANIIGNSPAMQAVFEAIGRVAETDADVLILGQTGTGKELVARAIHQGSPRHSARFVPVDCGSIPEELLESEFFGHERGAFTGAHSRSLGLLEFANKGTFFLDEIGELSPRLQAKLLRVLQERKIRRVGGTEEIDLDVRVIAATSRNIEQEIKEQRFRLDLYYRINVGRIELPPLRERKGDIPLLARHFVERYAREMGREEPGLDPDVVELLQAYPWPGNVRELQNVIKRTLAMSRGTTLLPEDLPDSIVAPEGRGAAPGSRSFFGRREEHIGAFEKSYLENLLTSLNGDVAAAARDAQLPRGTLYRLLKKHGLDPADFRH
ncbi:MAG: sigma-54-dependent transcriptional regulator [Tepidisphaerales bacterium]